MNFWMFFECLNLYVIFSWNARIKLMRWKERAALWLMLLLEWYNRYFSLSFRMNQTNKVLDFHRTLWLQHWNLRYNQLGFYMFKELIKRQTSVKVIHPLISQEVFVELFLSACFLPSFCTKKKTHRKWHDIFENY